MSVMVEKSNCKHELHEMGCTYRGMQWNSHDRKRFQNKESSVPFAFIPINSLMLA